MKYLTKSQYLFLKQELLKHKQEDIISEDQFGKIMSTYKEKEGLNFIKVILTVGAVLVGLGVLSFIASNWLYMSKSMKMIIIFVALGSTLLTSYKTEEAYSKISKAFLYLSGMIYGAGIFLIGQIFHLGGSLGDAFLLWTIGAIFITFLSEDIIMAVASHVLGLAFIILSFNENIILWGIGIVGLFYALNKYFNHYGLLTFLDNILNLCFLFYILNHFEFNDISTVSIFFIIGLLMYYIPHRLNRHVFRLQGLIIIGIMGLLLTIDEMWYDIISMRHANIFSVVFGIVFIIYLLSLVRKKHLTPLIFICGVLLRYYFDTLYDFLPKSMFFIIGGVILLAFGIYFENIRKHRGSDTDEDIIE